VSVPGDRDASVHELSGRALARGFDRIIVKEDSDRRGQEPGYVANLLANAIRYARPECECVVIEDEACAVRRALETMAEGEVLMIFTDAGEQVVSILAEHGATYTTLIPPVPEHDSGVHVMPTFASANQAFAYARTGSE
jgi:cyanophycin synthetase